MPRCCYFILTGGRLKDETIACFWWRLQVGPCMYEHDLPTRVWYWNVFVTTHVFAKKNKSGSGCDSVFNSSARHVWSYCVGLELLFELQCFFSPGALDMWYLSIFSNLFWFCCIAFDVFLWTGTVDLGWMNMYNFDANWRIANLDETKTKLCSPQLCLRQLVGAGRVAVGTLRCGPQGLDHAACTGNIRPLIYT